jgi:penicillin-binding protein 1B
VVFALLAFGAGFAIAVFMTRLDRVVTTRFEGQRFDVPSRVFSTPSILFAGLDVQHVNLRDTLVRLGYRSVSPDRKPEQGEFIWASNRVRIHLRPFEHPSRPEPARDIELRLRRGVIDDIRELPGNRTASVVLLEPEQLGAYYGPHHEQRELVRLDEVPSHLVAAVVAVEDQRFGSHPGIDLRRIVGAMVANLRAGRIRQGGSTLTQQLVKNFFLTPERTLRRKLQEAVMAILIEARYDKPEILEGYLNEIYLGQRGGTAIHGVGEASHFFFGKSAADLSIAESAQLAAIIQSPNRLSPHRNPEAAVERRNLVLLLMHEQHRIDASEYEAAVNEPLQVASVTPERAETRYFLDHLRRQLPEVYDGDVLTASGLEIYSTLDPRFQVAAVSALRGGLEALEQRHPNLRSKDPLKSLQGCLIALRPQTGEVLALVGGRDYGVSQFDRCTQARRQVGSVFKPFVYAAALEPRAGGPTLTLAARLSDEPLELKTSSGIWAPANYDHEFHGSVSVRTALSKSRNVPAARVALEVGIERVIEVSHRLGIESRLPNVPSLSLGTAELSPLEVARAYATIASGGFRATPHTFEDVVAGGETLERRTLRSERAIDAGTAYLMTSLLQEVVNSGTGARVRWMGLTGPIAGKTGTTDDEYDLWFVGFTPELVAVVWMGFDQPRPIKGVTSSEGPLPIWVRFVKAALGDQVLGVFMRPGVIREVEIDTESGGLALGACPEPRRELFIAGTEPAEICDLHAGSGGIRWRRNSSGPDGEDDRGFLDWIRRRF